MKRWEAVKYRRRRKGLKLGPKAYTGLMQLYIKSGAYDEMSFGNFLSEVLKFIASDDVSANRFIDFYKSKVGKSGGG
jgi:urease gamma subunit